MQLKPSCVNLLEAARQYEGSTNDDKPLLDATIQLEKVVVAHCRRSDGAFDEQLADYAFLPLSYTFKACQSRPGRIAESATKCLQVILEFGWKNSIGSELSHQLLLLLTLFGGGGPPSITVSEELKHEAFKALSLLFSDIRASPKAAASLTELSIIPAVGECVSTILDGSKRGESPDIQEEALKALRTLWKCVRSQQALTTFLPGTVSALTTCLMPSTKNPRSSKVLIGGLRALKEVLVGVVADMRVTNLKDDGVASSQTNGPPPLTKSWLKATTSQIHLALGNVVKLKSHSNPDVRKELENTCLVLLDECHSSLENSAALLVETAMIVTSDDEDDNQLISTGLKNLAILYPNINELIKTTAYNWATSLPRVMQSSDEGAKATALQNLSRAPKLLGDSEQVSEVLESALVGCLKDSVLSALESSNPGGSIQEAVTSDDLSTSLTVPVESVGAKQFGPLILSHESQRATREQFSNLLSHMGSPEMQLRMAGDLLDQISYTSGNQLLSSFWLCFQLLKSASAKTQDLDTFFTSDVTASDVQQDEVTELYNYSVSMLSEADSVDQDWRVLAVGLEVIAYCSECQGEEFRSNLVDALYPVVQLLGSSKQHLREHAITTLNIVSGSCGYNKTSDMIVENVDYLVNAVSLKLNTFNISPQTPRVLVMIIKLSGPSLLPYLDDVVGSIFAALDNFHGYPLLVDSLFSVLGEIVNESTNSGQLRIAAGGEINHKKHKPQPSSIKDVIDLLAKMKGKASTRERLEHQDFPRQPWKSAKELLDGKELKEDDEEEPEEEPASSKEAVKPAPTKVYTMVTSIARLSQHYLTSPSSHLRLRLLDLLSTASSALCNNEEAFLPLLNDVWPVVVKRLCDAEPYVVIGAAKTIGSLCKAAGDFMATRIRTEWQSIIKLIKSSKTKAENERQGRHVSGVHAVSWQVWDAFASLLVTVLEYVRIDDQMFEDCCDILGGLLERAEAREALETINADAAWLMDLRAGRIEKRTAPVMEGFTFASLEEF